MIFPSFASASGFVGNKAKKFLRKMMWKICLSSFSHLFQSEMLESRRREQKNKIKENKGKRTFFYFSLYLKEIKNSKISISISNFLGCCGVLEVSFFSTYPSSIIKVVNVSTAIMMMMMMMMTRRSVSLLLLLFL